MKKLRRRIEDSLRKGMGDLEKVARLCGVGCDPDTARHPYHVQTCPVCGATFCYACCGSQNVDQGGKHEPDYMLCPVCGHNVL